MNKIVLILILFISYSFSKYVAFQILDPKEHKEASQKLIAFYEFCILFGRERQV